MLSFEILRVSPVKCLIITYLINPLVWHSASKKMSVIGVMFIAFLLGGFEVFLFDTVTAFTPNTHILTGNSAIDLILKESDTVIINGRPYPLDHRIANAIKSYPDYYR